MTTIAWRYIMFSSWAFNMLFFTLCFFTGNGIFMLLAWVFIFSQVNASVRWNLHIRKDRREGNS